MNKAVDNYWGCGNPAVKRSKRGDCGQNVESYPQKKTGLSTGLAANVLDFLDDFRDLVVDIASFPHLLTDLLGGIHHCRVVSVSEIHPNLG